MMSLRPTIATLYIFFIFILTLSPFPANANDQIDRFLEGHSDETGRVETLKGLEKDGLSTVHLILKTANQRLVGIGVETKIRKRLKGLLSFASRVAREHHDEQNSILKNAIKAQLEPLLDRFRSRCAEQSAVISIYDSLGLWSTSDFWFFLQYAKNTVLLLEHHRRIQELIPSLSKMQLEEFTARLRTIRSHNTIHFGMLLDTGTMTESELTKMLQLAANRFVERLSPSPDGSPQTLLLKQREDEAFVPVMAKLVAAIKADNAAVISAYNRAYTSVVRQRSSPEREMRLQFYRLVAADSLDWMNSSGWMASTVPPTALPKYQVDGNAILLDFKVRPSCGSDLEK